jgi:gliding motility-associated-like protein
MRGYLQFCTLCGLCFFSIQAFGNHVVGGSLSMKQMDNTPGKYRITLSLLINTDHFEPDEEDLMKTEINYVSVIQKRDNTLFPVPVLHFDRFENLIYDNAACEHLNNLHTREYSYIADVQWDINSFTDVAGYYLAYERCCRDRNIVNIDNPGATGMVLYLDFPPLQMYPQFSSPEFPAMKGDFICSGKDFKFDLGAKDADNDVLKYSLVIPWKGNSLPNVPRPMAEPRPYAPVVWATGYSATNAIKGNPSLAIDSNTGLLSVKANQTGSFVFTVQVEKYRNNQLIGYVRHDFQFLVTDCSPKIPPVPTISQDNKPATTIEVCDGGSVTLETEFGPEWSYQWQKDGDNIPDAKYSTLNVSGPGAYSVVKSYKNECASDITSDVVDVTTGTGDNVSFDPIPVVCNTEKIVLSASPANGTFTGTGISGNTFDPSIAGAGAHQVTYSIGSQSGCAASKNIIIDVKAPISLGLPDEIRAKPNEAITFPTNPSQPDLTFLWTPAEGLNNQYLTSPTARVTDNITYTVIAKSPDGCQIKEEVKIITDVSLVISTAFTPDGDGLNDFWLIKGIEDLPECEVFIYNTWGELIFYSKGYVVNWDGKYKGKEVPGGMYLYKIDTKKDNKVFQGYITVIY